MPNKLTELMNRVVRGIGRLFTVADSGIAPSYRATAADVEKVAGTVTATDREGAAGLLAAGKTGSDPEIPPADDNPGSEIAKRAGSTDSTGTGQSLIHDLDYHELYLQAQRFDFDDPSVRSEILRRGLVENGYRDLVRQLDEHGFDGLPFSVRKEIVDRGVVKDGDPALALLRRLQQFDGLPRLTDADGIRRAVAQGWVEMFRGVSHAQHVADFKTGDHFPGRGRRGNGTYVYGRDPGSGGPDSVQLRQMAERNGRNVIHMVLHPDARVTDVDSLAAKQTEELGRLRREYEATGKSRDILEKIHVLSDLGRYGVVLGYDAYKINGSHAWVVLNRAVLTVER